MAKRRTVSAREVKLENLLTNHSMVYMGMFEEALTSLAERIAEEPSASSRLRASASKNAKDEVAPELRAQITEVFSGIREEASSERPPDPRAFKRYASGPAFDRGLEIVEKHDFGRPKLTERLSDDVLASYVFLLLSGDKELGKMFKEISEWKAGLPKPPWAG
jgi:hypothetical protein